jgi:MoxR-like ATPase
VESIKVWADRVIESVESVFLGKRSVIEKLLVALLCRGHVLLEDVPGLGKTILARAIAGAIGAKFARIQCTPDLLPADVLGVSVYNPKTGEFVFREGPVLSNIVLVDEINRATPRTQSALLEAMAENQITVEGRQLRLQIPFFLIATENPIEFEGTFPLPEAQKDRFLLCLSIGYPGREHELKVVEEQRRVTHPVTDVSPVSTAEEIAELQQQVVTVYVEPDVSGYIMDIIEATRNSPYVRIGASPRATIALYKSAQAYAAIQGRDYVLPDDVKTMVHPILVQRLILKAEYEVRGHTPGDVIQSVLNGVEVPVLKER